MRYCEVAGGEGGGGPNMAATDNPGGPPMAGDHPKCDKPQVVLPASEL